METAFTDGGRLLPEVIAPASDRALQSLVLRRGWAAAAGEAVHHLPTLAGRPRGSGRGRPPIYLPW